MHSWKCEPEIIFDFIVNTGFYFLWSLNVVMYLRRLGIWFGKISFPWNPYNASCYALRWKLMWNYKANHFWMTIKECEFVRFITNTVTIHANTNTNTNTKYYYNMLLQYLQEQLFFLKAGFSDHNLGYWHSGAKKKIFFAQICFCRYFFLHKYASVKKKLFFAQICFCG